MGVVYKWAGYSEKELAVKSDGASAVMEHRVNCAKKIVRLVARQIVTYYCQHIGHFYIIRKPHSTACLRQQLPLFSASPSRSSRSATSDLLLF